MAPKRSVHTEAVLAKVAQIKQMHEYAEKHQAIPFMQEKVSLRDEATRVQHMAPQERAAWMQQVGQEHAIKVAQHLVKRQANGNPL